eukprot:4238687-Prymnesium_polylepis.1
MASSSAVFCALALPSRTSTGSPNEGSAPPPPSRRPVLRVPWRCVRIGCPSSEPRDRPIGRRPLSEVHAPRSRKLIEDAIIAAHFRKVRQTQLSLSSKVRTCATRAVSFHKRAGNCA